MRQARLTIRRMMIGVVAASLLFAMVRLANELTYWTFSYGWNTSVLRVGQQLIVCEDVRFGETIIPAGTRCIVVSDLTDEDSAYPYRKVNVEIIEGRQKGSSGTVERLLLRVR
jgi:hypothetical protein